MKREALFMIAILTTTLALSVSTQSAQATTEAKQFRLYAYAKVVSEAGVKKDVLVQIDAAIGCGYNSSVTAVNPKASLMVNGIKRVATVEQFYEVNDNEFIYEVDSVEGHAIGAAVWMDGSQFDCTMKPATLKTGNTGMFFIRDGVDYNFLANRGDSWQLSFM